MPNEPTFITSMIEDVWSDTPERVILEDNSSFHFEVADAVARLSRAGDPMLAIRLRPLDVEANVKSVFEYLLIPQDTDDNDVRQLRGERLKKFMAAISHTGGLVPDEHGKCNELIGKTGWGITGVRTNEQNNEEENTIRAYIKPTQ